MRTSYAALLYRGPPYSWRASFFRRAKESPHDTIAGSPGMTAGPTPILKDRMRRLFVFVLLAGTALAQGDFYLKDGDRVVFYGDSITDQRLYTAFTESYVITRFP